MNRQGQAFPVALAIGAILSIQAGAAVAVNLFDEIGPAGSVFLRVVIATAILMAFWRPALRGRSAAAWRTAALFGFVLAAMNFSFYEGLERVPLGIAVTLEFIGPLGVAIIGSRRSRDLLWVGLAAGGILLLSPGLGGDLDTLGAGLCLLAGFFWGVYIYVAERVGQLFERGDGLALAMLVSTVLLAPVGIAEAGTDLVGGEVLLAGLAIALLSTAIPYSFELEALRHLPKGTFGVLMSLEPGVAALVGFIALDQALDSTELVAIALVVTASAGALRSAAVTPREGWA